MRNWLLSITFLLLFAAGASAADKVYKVQSPSGELKVEVSVGAAINWSVERAGTKILEPSPIAMTLSDGTVFGKNAKVKKTTRSSTDRTITPVYYRQSEVRDKYNEMTLQCGGFNLIFRVYDNAAAYRFTAAQKAPFTVESEQAEFRLSEPGNGFIPYCRKKNDSVECQFSTSFESQYSNIELKDWETDRLAFLPVTIDAPNGMKVCITESDLLNYPGMYLWNQDKDNKLEAVFAPYPKEIKQGGHNMLQGLVQSRENYIAKAEANEAFPWRIVIVAKEDKELLTCDVPWLLGKEPSKGEDFSWVRPGKVAWDWWNAWNLYGVDFEAGINNDTYKYYIDFASRSGIEYVILDEGWAVKKAADLFQLVPEIDLKELCNYAEKKGVGLILWAGYWAFEKDMERACREYSAMGIKGFKVDFMDRDDQPMVDFYRRTAETAARYHLMIDFHGAFKPAGLQRTFPNVVNFEGVYGLENVKGEKKYEIDLVTYEVSIPFVRMVAGPADYTQGAMRNATKSNFRYVTSEAMSQGTRCRQLAEYVIFDAPLTMLCDSPSNYLNEKECLGFIADVPTTWDQTVALEGKAGEYVAIARRKGENWYVGAITDWNERELSLDLSFIGKAYDMDIYRDGANAAKAARDYKKDWQLFPENGKIDIKMAPGGGWAAVIRQNPLPPEKTDKDWARFSYYEDKNVEVTERPRAVLFGDSITRNWAKLHGKWLDEHGFVGRGIGGQTTMQMLVRFRADVIDLNPEYVAILAGINDIARNNGYIAVENTFNNIVSMVELAELHGIKPILCTVCPAGEIGWRRRVGDPRPQIAELNTLITAYAAEHDIPLADYHSALKDENDALDARYVTDAVHPNKEGYKVMESVLLSILPDPLVVMSYNVRYGKANDGDNSWENRRSASPAMINAVKPDIIGLQEALPEQEGYITEQCPKYASYGIGRNDGVEGERMSIVYNTKRLDMKEHGTWWLSETPDVPSTGWDAKYPRTATWALMKDRHSGKEFYFVDTHLDHRGVQARINGLKMVVSKIREMNPDVPMFLVGDFNVEPADSCLFALAGLMQDSRTNARISDQTPSFNGFKEPKKIIDYIYYSGIEAPESFRVVTEPYDNKPFISDHYPIVAKFILK